jgi:hypothetical protein
VRYLSHRCDQESRNSSPRAVLRRRGPKEDTRSAGYNLGRSTGRERSEISWQKMNHVQRCAPKPRTPIAGVLVHRETSSVMVSKRCTTSIPALVVTFSGPSDVGFLLEDLVFHRGRPRHSSRCLSLESTAVDLSIFLVVPRGACPSSLSGKVKHTVLHPSNSLI